MLFRIFGKSHFQQMLLPTPPKEAVDHYDKHIVHFCEQIVIKVTPTDIQSSDT